MSVVATQSAVSGAHSGSGDVAWANTNNIVGEGAGSATSTVPLFATTTDFLFAKFAFALSINSVIRGFSWRVKRSRTGASSTIIDSSVHLVKAGTLVGSDFNTAGLWPTSLTFLTYGGSTELGGVSWVAADVNDANFGFAIKAQEDGDGSGTPNVDFCEMSVYYDLLERSFITVVGG